MVVSGPTSSLTSPARDARTSSSLTASPTICAGVARNIADPCDRSGSRAHGQSFGTLADPRNAVPGGCVSERATCRDAFWQILLYDGGGRREKRQCHFAVP